MALRGGLSGNHLLRQKRHMQERREIGLPGFARGVQREVEKLIAEMRAAIFRYLRRYPRRIQGGGRPLEFRPRRNMRVGSGIDNRNTAQFHAERIGHAEIAAVRGNPFKAEAVSSGRLPGHQKPGRPGPLRGFRQKIARAHRVYRQDEGFDPGPQARAERLAPALGRAHQNLGGIAAAVKGPETGNQDGHDGRNLGRAAGWHKPGIASCLIRLAVLSPRAMSLVRLSGVSKAFANGVEALDGFDLTVNAGEVVSLIGPSGCGKTTALRIIAGLDTPSSGEIVWTSGRPPETGYVFQEPTLMPWATAFANVWLPLRLRGVSKTQAQERVTEVLTLVGLAEFAAAKPSQLSGGMKMRVAIARALVTRPALLLMDEPFAALDEITRFRLNDELLNLRESLKLTIVFVTHSVFEAVYLSSRIAVMTPRPGRLAGQTAIAEPYPRMETFRTTLAYAEYAQDVSRRLRAALPLQT